MNQNNTEAQARKYIMMTEAPVERLVSKMAVPSIVSMMISAVYNIADTFFVGRISTQATGAVGIVFSYMALIQAAAFFFGHGSAHYISKRLGARDPGSASKMAAVGFFSAFSVGVLIASVCMIFRTPVLYLFGSTETILPDSSDYFFYILLGTPFIMTSFVMNNQMRLQGNALMGMIGISAGAVLNIILDPVLIFAADMGVAGASLATAVSQFVSFWILLHLCGRRDGIAIKISNFKPSLELYRHICKGGLPSLCRLGIASVSTIVLNQLAQGYGDSAIAAFSVVSRVMGFANSAMIGFGQGFQPVCGFNFGAKKYQRVKDAFWFSVKVGTVYCAAISIIGLMFAPRIIAFFRAEDADVIAVGAAALRFSCIAFVLNGYVTIASMYLQNIGSVFPASVLALARQGLFLIPVMYVMNIFLGLKGLEYSQLFADLLTFGISLLYGLSGLKKMADSGSQ